MSLSVWTLLADEDDDLPAPLIGRDLERGVEDGICSGDSSRRSLGDDDNIVGVRLELHHDILNEKPGMNFAAKLGEVVHHETLHFRDIPQMREVGVARLEEVNPMMEIVVRQHAHLLAKDRCRVFMPEVSTDSRFMRFFASST